jgi:hypothetical protein
MPTLSESGQRLCPFLNRIILRVTWWARDQCAYQVRHTFSLHELYPLLYMSEEGHDGCSNRKYIVGGSSCIVRLVAIS